MSDFIFGVFVVVVTNFISVVLIYSYADVQASRYQEAATICDKVSSEVDRFDLYTVRCTNGAVFNIKEVSTK